MSVLGLIASGNFITVNKLVARTVGLNESVILGALCSELNYCEKTGQITESGFFPFSVDMLQQETTIGEKPQKQAISNLINAGLLEQRNFGQPQKRHFRINEEAIVNLIFQNRPNGVFKTAQKSELKPPKGSNYIKNIINKDYTSTTEDISISIDNILEYILNAFNNNKNIKAPVQKIPFMSKRYNDLMLSVETYGFDEVLEAVEHLDDNDFFQTWKPNFDWVVNPNNMIKIIEGNYKHNDKQTGDASKEWLEKWVAKDDEE